jgi:hypothetical protein
MNNLTIQLVYHFFLSLSLGTALFGWIASPKLTGAGFIRLITGHAAIFLGLAVAVDLAFNLTQDLMIQVPLLVLFIISWRYHPDERPWWTWLLYTLQSILTLVLVYRFSSSFVFLFSSLLFLGITHYAMLLGHYYLVVPKLTEKPLLVCLQIFWGIFLVKFLWSSITLSGATKYLVEGSMLGEGFLFNWILVSMRALWGYGAMLVLSYFAWRLCRMRSIQSATGVLYIMVFFVFVGELISSYIYLKLGLCI